MFQNCTTFNLSCIKIEKGNILYIYIYIYIYIYSIACWQHIMELISIENKHKKSSEFTSYIYIIF